MATPTLTMPDFPKPSGYKITKMSNVLSSAPIVGAHRTQTRLIGEEYHQLSLSYDPMDRNDFGTLASFLNGLQGSHTHFNVLIPQLVPGVSPLSMGNYVSLSSGRMGQITNAGNAVATQLFSASSNPASTVTVSNQFSTTIGVPVAVYLEVTGAVGAVTVSLNASSSAAGASTLSEVRTIHNGRNFVYLTPTASQGCYVRVTHSAGASVSAVSIMTGIQTTATTLSTAIELNATDIGSYYLPGPATIMPCSLASNGLSISYDPDSFIRLSLKLMERQL